MSSCRTIAGRSMDGCRRAEPSFPDAEKSAPKSRAFSELSRKVPGIRLRAWA